MPCLCLPPFSDPAVWALPPEAPALGTDNRPPQAGPRLDPDDPSQPNDGADWRRILIEAGLTVAVEHDGETLHFAEHVQYMMDLAYSQHLTARRERWEATEAGPPPPPVPLSRDPQDGTHALLDALEGLAAAQARAYVAEHPEARIAGAPPPAPGMYDGWPPAQPTGEPRMDDGSHLLASERGRRRIDPRTGLRMIREMVLTEGAWPHWEWREDTDGPAGPGPWGPGTSFGTPEEPAQMSPRASMRGHLTRIGRLDLLHKYLPWPGDPPL